MDIAAFEAEPTGVGVGCWLEAGGGADGFGERGVGVGWGLEEFTLFFEECGDFTLLGGPHVLFPVVERFGGGGDDVLDLLGDAVVGAGGEK